ncbi:MAG: pyridoxamine 5'-phosphate oxidase [Giesbergeria sp.]
MADLASLRKDYMLAGLRKRDLSADPFQQFQRWFDEARTAGVIEPNAATLATATPDGAPSARTVLLKGYDERGFVFFTNYESRKSRELAANARACLVFPWLALERQVTITGGVSRVSREETAAYFATRPVGNQLGAWASPQSEVVADRDALESSRRAAAARFAGQVIPPPPHWGGFRISPAAIEFWQGRTDRLHDRLRYRRDSQTWIVERLAP